MSGKLNPFLERKLQEIPHSLLRYVVEVEPGTREAVKAQLRPLPQLTVLSQPADRFIAVEAPPEILPRIEAIPEVTKISAETMVWIKGPILGFPLPHEVLRIGPPARTDPYLGQVRLSSVEIPVGPTQAIAQAPFRALQMRNMIILTTDRAREFIGLPKDNKIKLRCAVADTGATIPHFLLHPNTSVSLFSQVPGETPQDSMSHGMWVTTAAFGDDFVHPVYGRCEGAADPEEVAHFKCLSTLGFGMTSWILSAIFAAWEWGARVLSMSLGGPQQGSALDDDPTSRLITSLREEMITVVAAGNDGVEWSIGSPGVCPDALTVGAWSMTDDGLSYFSSRGPSGEFYRDNPDVWRRDLARRGQDLRKPDVCAPGGGRISKDDQDEQLLSGVTGWYDPYGDALPGWGVMKGTSMATPITAGAIALAVDRGLVRTAADVKRLMARGRTKQSDQGYGLLTWGRLQ